MGREGSYLQFQRINKNITTGKGAKKVNLVSKFVRPPAFPLALWHCFLLVCQDLSYDIHIGDGVLESSAPTINLGEYVGEFLMSG